MLYFIYQKVLMTPFNIRFSTKNYLCEFKSRTHKFKGLFLISDVYTQISIRFGKTHSINTHLRLEIRPIKPYYIP